MAAPLAEASPYLEMVERALREDVRTGDVTSRLLVPEGSRGSGRLVAREPMVCCALVVAHACFTLLDPDVQFETLVREGDTLAAGAVMASVSGDLRAMLTAERTALNFLQRACGIATVTRACAEAVSGTRAWVLDTRKTAPGLRALDKHAVRVGGGRSHRAGLDDKVLVKDNHVAIAGSITEAVRRAFLGARAADVEVEVDSLEQLDELLALSRLPHAVLLDNFAPDEVREAVGRVAGRMFVEVSGGVDLGTIRDHAEAGADGVSLGMLTHSVRAANVAFDLDPSRPAC